MFVTYWLHNLHLYIFKYLEFILIENSVHLEDLQPRVTLAFKPYQFVSHIDGCDKPDGMDQSKDIWARLELDM